LLNGVKEQLELRLQRVRRATNQLQREMRISKSAGYS